VTDSKNGCTGWIIWNSKILLLIGDSMEVSVIVSEKRQELVKSIRCLEEAYGAIDVASHQILMAFRDSDDANQEMVENDFRKPLKNILDCPWKGLDNLIDILKDDLGSVEDEIEKQMEAA